MPVLKESCSRHVALQGLSTYTLDWEANVVILVWIYELLSPVSILRTCDSV